MAAPAVAIAAAAASAVDLLKYVDTRIGAGGVGYGAGSDNPGAQVPFGALRLGPDTSPEVLPTLAFEHYGGYHASDEYIRAFSHTHMVGPGVGDWGNFGVMPHCGAVPSDAFGKKHSRGWRSKKVAGTERAQAGYYAVGLDAPALATAELTAGGTHAGVHRYNFSAKCARTEARSLVVDYCNTAVGDPSTCSNASSTSDGQTLSASVFMHGSLSGRSSIGGVWVHLHLAFDQPATIVPWNSSESSGATVTFPSATDSVIVRAGISFIDAAHAKGNLAAQVGGASFDSVLASAQARWSGVLSSVAVSAGSSPALVKLATALYHTHCAPTTYSESTGEYLGMDGAVHSVGQWDQRQSAPRAYMSDMSLWDVHRTQLPWLVMSNPDRADDVVRSLQAMLDDGGALPRWPLANVYTGCMIGSHGVVSIADSILKSNGRGRYNTTHLYQGMLRQATTAHEHGRDAAGLKDYETLGYIAFETSHESASKTLAWAFDDWAVGQVAKQLGDTANAALLQNRSAAYKNLWSDKRQLLCAKSRDGKSKCPLDASLPYFVYKGGSAGGSFVESNALQYTMSFVPQDPAGLVALFPSKAAFAKKLDEFFSKSRPVKQGGEWPLGNALANSWYWAGNEPDLLAVWLFNYAGRPDLTAKWSRWLIDNEYTTKPDGLPGNDDFGTMSAWYAWAAVGLYPLPASSTYLVGSPSFETAVLRLSGRDGAPDSHVSIVAHGASDSAIYVQRATVNGRPLNSPFVDWSDLAAGNTTLEFWMGSSPSTWGHN